MKERTKTVESIWWVCKFVACFWVFFYVFLLAGVQGGIFPEPSDPSPSHLRLVIAQVGYAVVLAIIWPVKLLRIEGSAEAVLVFALPFGYAAAGLALRNCLRRVIKPRA